MAKKADREDVRAAAATARTCAGAVRDAFRGYLQTVDSEAAALEREGRSERAQIVRLVAAEARAAFPRSEAAAAAPALSVTILVDGRDWPAKWRFNPETQVFARAALRDGILWIALLDHGRPATLGLAGIDLAQRKAVALWQAPCGKLMDMVPFAGLAIGDERSYLSIIGTGLMEFPGANMRGKAYTAQPRILSEKDGLPPGGIAGIAYHEGKLWVGYGTFGKESGLGTWDPKTGKWEGLFSSAVKGKSALAAGRTYEVDQITSTPDGLLFWVSDAAFELRGLWKLDAGAAVPELLCGEIRECGLIADSGEERWLLSRNGLARLVPALSRVDMLLANRDARTPREPAKWPLHDEPFVPDVAGSGLILGYYGFGKLDLSTAAVRGDQLWARYGQSQLVVLRRGRPFAEAKKMDNNILNGGRVLQFFNFPQGIVAVGDGTIGLIEASP
jgi:hypothetical protein